MSLTDRMWQAWQAWQALTFRGGMRNFRWGIRGVEFRRSG